MNIKGEKGFTLVEVIASTILLTLILFSFFTLILSSAKTTKTSEGIIDYTYLAQTEMENAYGLSSTSKPTNWETTKILLPNLGYSYFTEKDGYSIFKKQIVSEDIYILLKIKKSDPINYNDLTNLIIEVYTNDNNVLKSKMETIINWGE